MEKNCILLIPHIEKKIEEKGHDSLWHVWYDWLRSSLIPKASAGPKGENDNSLLTSSLIKL